MNNVTIFLILLTINFSCYSSKYIGLGNNVTLTGDQYEILDYLIFEENTNILRFMGGTGIHLEPCLKGFKCFNYRKIVIAIPIQCELLEYGKWQYGDYNYSIDQFVDSIRYDDYEHNQAANVLVKVSKVNEEIGYFIYSNKNGVLSFTLINKEGESQLNNNNTTYFLSSQDGMLKDGCVLSLDEDKFPIMRRKRY